MHKLFVFDCDGVLVDSEVLSNRVMAEAIRAEGLTVSDEEVLQTYVGDTMFNVMKDVEGKLGRPLRTDWLTSFETKRVEVFKRELEAVPGVSDVVRQLAKQNRRFCVASQAKVEKLHLTLGLTGLLDFFKDSIFSAAMVARPKPSPDLYLYVADKFGLKPADCVVIEDSPKGATAGVAAGMKVFGYAKRGHADTLQSIGAQVFYDMHELPALLGL